MKETFLTEQRNEEKPTFLQKLKNFGEKTLTFFYFVKCVCCFTSILAFANIVFFIFKMGDISDFLLTIAAFSGILGVLSGIIACPLKLFGNVIKLVVGGFSIGLGFAGIGCVVGVMIGAVISVFMVFVAPAIVTIPHYFNELTIT